MANIFGHIRLMTPDVARAREFYGSVFNWDIEDVQVPGPGCEEGVDISCAMIDTGAVPSGQMIEMAGPQWEGVPPHWMVQIVVDDLDRTVARCVELGGVVRAPRKDVPGVGAFAMLDDPQGAVFGIWQQLGERGPDPAPRDPANAFSWAELNTSDNDDASSFYGGLFESWTFEPWEMGEGFPPYVRLQTGESICGGIIEIEEIAQGKFPANWLTYINVADVETAKEKIAAHGGMLIIDSTVIPGAGCFAVFMDPLGATFGVWGPVPA